jgi:hypothetical protein
MAGDIKQSETHFTAKAWLGFTNTDKVRTGLEFQVKT